MNEPVLSGVATERSEALENLVLQDQRFEPLGAKRNRNHVTCRQSQLVEAASIFPGQRTRRADSGSPGGGPGLGLLDHPAIGLQTGSGRVGGRPILGRASSIEHSE